MASRNLRIGFALLCMTSLMGVQEGCFGKPLSPEKLCTKSGGTWDDSKCPGVWPPACGESLDQTPPTECGKEEVCKCPADKPYWKDGYGCWGETECAKKCDGTATACSSISKDDCFDQEGCYRDSYYHKQTCTGTKHHYKSCYKTDTCYQSETCYSGGSYYDCGYYYDCSYYYDCGWDESYTYDCSHWEYTGPCKGTVTPCSDSELNGPDECGDQKGCAWK